MTELTNCTNSGCRTDLCRHCKDWPDRHSNWNLSTAVAGQCWIKCKEVCSTPQTQRSSIWRQRQARYALKQPWPVSTCVHWKPGVTFHRCLEPTVGKKTLVVDPFSVKRHLWFHLAITCWRNILIANDIGNLEYSTSTSRVASLASWLNK